MQMKSSAPGKEDHRGPGFLYRPVVRVVSVWLWAIAGPLIVALLALSCSRCYEASATDHATGQIVNMQ